MKQTGKQLASRIDRHYYQNLDPYVRMKRMAGWGGLAIGILYSGWAFTGWGSPQTSTGDLSQAHAAWNDQGCANCHLPFVPIRPDAWGGNSVKNVALNNQQCNTKCHAVTDHFAAHTVQERLERESCMECHREHQGRNHSLVDLADRSCARCHAQIENSVKPEIENRVANVSQFSKPNGHPEFRIKKQKDPGTIAFSHIQHMRAGQPKTPGDETAKSFGELESQFRQRYAHGKTVALEDLIQLNCNDCHEPDAAVAGFESLTPDARIDGKRPHSANQHRLYKPVNFEKHCLACHALDGVPHGLDRHALAVAVDKLISVRNAEFSIQQSGQPGVMRLDIDRQNLDERAVRLKQLLSDESQCDKCHELTPQSPTRIVAPSQVPQRWFKNAVFPHGDHLMVACQDCHHEAFAISDGKVDAKAESDQVMIAGLENCRGCHIHEARERSKKFDAGVAHVATADCVDCHRYHVDAPNPQIRLESAAQVHPNRESIQRYLTQGAPR